MRLSFTWQYLLKGCYVKLITYLVMVLMFVISHMVECANILVIWQHLYGRRNHLSPIWQQLFKQLWLFIRKTLKQQPISHNFNLSPLPPFSRLYKVFISTHLHGPLKEMKKKRRKNRKKEDPDKASPGFSLIFFSLISYSLFFSGLRSSNN